jgi:hypothetical protein
MFQTKAQAIDRRGWRQTSEAVSAWSGLPGARRILETSVLFTSICLFWGFILFFALTTALR